MESFDLGNNKHKGNPDNAVADELARQGLILPFVKPEPALPISLATLNTLINQ